MKTVGGPSGFYILWKNFPGKEFKRRRKKGLGQVM